MSRVAWWYLVEDKTTHERFCAYGNFKLPWMGVTRLFAFAPLDYPYRKSTPYGEVYNITNDVKYNKTKHRIVHQTMTKVA